MVKRLFIDRGIPVKARREQDYAFIQSLVYENDFLMKHSPDYANTGKFAGGPKKSNTVRGLGYL